MSTHIAVVTGRLAYEEAVRQARLLESLGYKVEVIRAPTDVALFTSPKMLSALLSGRSYDIVVVPGLWRYSALTVGRELGVRVVRGPSHIGDLYRVASLLPIEKWSPELPAEKLVSNTIAETVLRWYYTESRSNPFYVSQYSATKIPRAPPPLIPVAEVYPDKGLGEVILRLVELNYEAIVLGYYEDTDAEKVKKHVKTIEKEGFNGIIGVDGLSPGTQARLASSGLSVELFLSVTPGNVEAFTREPSLWEKNLLVVLPFSYGEESLTKDLAEALESTVRKLSEAGIHYVLIDPSLPPPGVSSVLERLYLMRILARRLGKPGFIGVSNVIELFDADSPGLNGLMSVLAVESGAVMGLVTEESVKTRGSFAEALNAAIMVSYSYHSRRPPKDLGIDLLYLKSKTDHTMVATGGRRPIPAVAGGNRGPIGGWDPGGSVVITIDRSRCTILYRWSSDEDWYEARNWYEAMQHIYRLDRVRHVGHAFYLGREIYKAELALRACKEYVQDEDLLKGKTLCCRGNKKERLG